jgi:hypothetical protein
MEKKKQKELLIELMNMDKKDTSVDWLFDQLWETPKDKLAWFKILMEAKAIHEQQIKEAYLAGDCQNQTAEQYYNQTYE